MSDGFLEDVEEEEEEPEEAEVIDAEFEEVEDTGVTEPPQPAQNNGVLQPASNLEEIKEVYDQFEKIKTELLSKGDMQDISGSMHITKSGWRKIATAFNVSVETTMEKKTVEGGVVKWRIKAVATAPNGKSASGVGMCASNESNFMESVADGSKDKEWVMENHDEPENIFKIDGNWRRIKDPRAVNEHNIYATAATRAKNRAISDLVGGGEVSAEEMGADAYL